MSAPHSPGGVSFVRASRSVATHTFTPAACAASTMLYSTHRIHTKYTQKCRLCLKFDITSTAGYTNFAEVVGMTLAVDMCTPAYRTKWA